MEPDPENLIPPDRVEPRKLLNRRPPELSRKSIAFRFAAKSQGIRIRRLVCFFSEIGNLEGARTSLSQAQNLSCGKETVTLAVLEGVICPAAELRAKRMWDFPTAVLLATGRPTVAILREFSAQPAVLILAGGRNAELQLGSTHVSRGFHVPIPLVNELLGNWEILTAERVTFPDATDEIQKLVSRVTLERCFDRKFWLKL